MTFVTGLSAITLRVASMARSVQFYRDVLGLRLLYGGERAAFSSFQVGEGYLNLELSKEVATAWGRVILHCDDVDAMHRRLTAQGLMVPYPMDASWGERYFHLRDPDGHEISLAKPLGRWPRG